MDIELKMPDLATTDSAMRVVRWLVVIGQAVTRGDPILEVETDKATMELEAIASGRLKAIHVQPDDSVSVGQLVATLETVDSASSPVVDIPRAADTNPEPKKGMFAKNRAAAVAPAATATERFVPLSPTQRSVARRMQESKQSIPHFYLQTSANAEPMIARRQGAPAPVIWDAFFVHAAARALGKFERMGFRFADDHLERCGADAIGVAVDNGGELFVIPLAAPEAKTPERLSEDIRAAVGKLQSGDPDARKLQPAIFTVTNLGAAGIESFTAILNPPEAAILAIGKVAPVAVVSDGTIAAQHRVSLTLSVDHRVVNGKYAAEFLQTIVQELESL